MDIGTSADRVSKHKLSDRSMFHNVKCAKLYNAVFAACKTPKLHDMFIFNVHEDV